ncbi:MAG: hypothetical protein J3Q66DRAFT_354576 [Benniella sp.]|nr:MAG: hypothetical protein J3Q66DRAFT_354576 [Benniella sp.]
MKFTSAVLTLSAVMAVAQVAALPVLPSFQQPGLILGNPSSDIEHIVEAVDPALPGPASVIKEASEGLPVHNPLPKKRLLNLVTDMLGGLLGQGGIYGGDGGTTQG